MILITGFNDAQAPLAELTVPLMRDYARRKRLGFRCAHFNAIGKEAYWQKILLTLQAFEDGFDNVFWLDVDQAITNPDIEPPFYRLGFQASMDWGKDAKTANDFSMCGYVANILTRCAFEAVNARHAECINGDFPEQTPMREFFAMNDRLFRGLARRELNAVPDEVSPGNVVDPWQPGDFAAHLTMLPVPERVALFHKIMARNK